MVKICQTGLLKLKFEIRPKNAFSGFCQKFSHAMDEVEIFFCQFPNPWTLRVSGMSCNTSKCEKSQNHCSLLCMSNAFIMVVQKLILLKETSKTQNFLLQSDKRVG
jgi:hypothetical protein